LEESDVVEPEREKDLEARLRKMEEQLRELQAQQPGALYRRLVPPEVRRHLQAARKERLLALRAWIDAAIARTEEPPERPRRAESVRIE
jgi:hypothetical protein